jgi:hypothetical protein
MQISRLRGQLINAGTSYTSSWEAQTSWNFIQHFAVGVRIHVKTRTSCPRWRGKCRSAIPIRRYPAKLMQVRFGEHGFESLERDNAFPPPPMFCFSAGYSSSSIYLRTSLCNFCPCTYRNASNACVRQSKVLDR